MRIYPGADGKFKFYEDENDNYNYEKGKYAVFNMKWNNKLQELTISDRKGTFKGMVKQRSFNIVLVKKGHGINSAITTDADKSINYDGKAIVVKFK